IYKDIMMKLKNYLFYTILLTILFICCGPVSTVAGSEAGSTLLNDSNGVGNHIVVDFFYNPTCGSCQKVLPFIKEYEANSSIVRVNYNNLADNQSNVEKFTVMQNKLGNVHLHVPLVIIGDRYLNGEENITRNLDRLVSDINATKVVPHISGSSGRPLEAAPLNSIQDSDSIHFFYSPTCGSCQKVLPFIKEYAQTHPQTKIEFNDLTGNKTNIERFSQYRSMFPDESIYVPAVFIGDTLLQGEVNITSKFNSTVEAFQNNLSSTGSSGGRISSEGTSSMNLVVLMVAAIGEGLNPCGLLVLALLLVSLMATSTRRMVLCVGLAYICAFFLVRLLSGFAIFSVIQLPGIATSFTLLAAAIAIIAGLIQIKDGLSKEQKPLLSIPVSKKGLISSYMKKASIPGGFIAGVLVGIYGMACTAGIYISILGMLYKDLTYGLLYLILYNIIVIIPLIAILLLVFFGLAPEKVNTWREERKSMLRLMIGIVMVLMGIIILIPMI
ncbi:MAG TPA: hypothetical protein VN372_02535, partial [Methanospirillum sp.]|nr:hypothetical protein [Methanospirillum sp.]